MRCLEPEGSAGDVVTCAIGRSLRGRQFSPVREGWLDGIYPSGRVFLAPVPSLHPQACGSAHGESSSRCIYLRSGDVALLYSRINAKHESPGSIRGKTMELFKCVFVLLACCAVCLATAGSKEEDTLVDRGFRAMHRVYEDCQQRNIAISPCMKKKAIAFFERLGRMRLLPLSENLELIRTVDEMPKSSVSELETSLGRNAAGKDEILNEILFDRVASLLNSFNIQIRLPRTSPGELKRGMEEGRGKMKKMMGMMMMGVAMKMAALIPIALGVLFLLAGKALIISKIALVLSLIIGLKKLLSQKQNHHDHGGWQQSGGGWDRSLKNVLSSTEAATTEQTRGFAQSLAYSARHQH